MAIAVDEHDVVRDLREFTLHHAGGNASRHNRETSSTLALSTEVTFSGGRGPVAPLERTTRSISPVE